MVYCITPLCVAETYGHAHRGNEAIYYSREETSEVQDQLKSHLSIMAMYCE